MKLGRPIIAVLISCLLILGQTALVFGADAPARPAGCKKCHCQMPACCAKPTSTPQPTPAAPVRTITQPAPDGLVILVTALLSAPASAPAQFVPTVLPTQATHVPLYQRNCVLLI